MLVGIFEKSRRVRIARNSVGFVFDMLSPVAWLEALRSAPTWGNQPRKGEEAASAALLDWTLCAPVPVPPLLAETALEARTKTPAKHSAGWKLECCRLITQGGL